MDGTPRIFEREPTRDELALGYAWGKDGAGELHVLRGVSQDDRRAHFYVIGATRTGKTKFLEYLISQDIKNGEGFGVIDPHGDLIEEVKTLLTGADSGDLAERVILIDPTDNEKIVCFNPLELTEGVSPAELANELVLAFKKIWADSWGARMEDILRNTLIALIEKGQTLAEIPLVFKDVELRTKLTRGIKNEACRNFFEKFEALNRRDKTEWPESTLNKVSAFLADERVKRIFVSPKSTFNLREIMDDGKILLIKLDKGRLKGAGDLLGSLLLSKLQMAAFSRSDIPEHERTPFYLYIDEFQNFATESFSDTLAEAGKYKLLLTLAHQNLDQLDASLRASLIANCGLQAYFRVSRLDAELLAKEAFAGVYDEAPHWESYFQELQSFPPRVCLVKNKLAGGIVFIFIPEVQIASADYDRIADIGAEYLRRNDNIEREYHERRKLLLNDGKAPEKDDELYESGEISELKNYERLIKGGENDYVEFKPGIRWDAERGIVDKQMERMVAKEVAAFMNSDGGILFIGISDTGEIIGIEGDYAAMNGIKKNKDGFLLQLGQLLNARLGSQFSQYAKVSIIPLQGKDVCIVEVKASAMPAYVRNDNREEFYVRTSAASVPMGVREANEYIKTRF